MFLNIMAVLLRLFTAYGRIFAGSFGLYYRHGLTVFTQQNIIAELKAAMRIGWFGHAFQKFCRDGVLFHNLEGIFDIPACLGKLFVNKLLTGFGFRAGHV